MYLISKHLILFIYHDNNLPQVSEMHFISLEPFALCYVSGYFLAFYIDYFCQVMER